MTTASVYMLNQTNLTANIMINNGNQFSIDGTSDSAKWAANTAVKTFQSPGMQPGNFNAGKNQVLMNLANQQTYLYNLDIANTNPGSIQVHIFFYDVGQSYAGVIMLYAGRPLTQPPLLIGPAPVPSPIQFA
jgi:hypothetical protein